jgi:thiol-disulfide isomerase/thioredoxin
MGKASRTKRDGSARERIAAQRAAAKRVETRNRVLLASGAVVVVIAIVVAFVLVKANGNSKSPGASSNGPTGAALTAVVNKTTSVPASTLETVGAGTVTGGPTAVSGPPLTSGGKPEMLYVGAEYCPYCAAQRWAMIVALSRFGTFSGLHTIHSATRDVYSNTPTFTFAGSHYTSKYVSFVPVEETTNVPNGPSTYTPLQKPTAAQQALLTKYNKQGSIPFIDFGNKYIQVGNDRGFGPQDLSGKTWAQIAAALHDPSSPIAKAVGGSANWTTAAICKLTGNQPASACTPAVKALEAKL